MDLYSVWKFLYENLQPIDGVQSKLTLNQLALLFIQSSRKQLISDLNLPPRVDSPLDPIKIENETHMKDNSECTQNIEDCDTQPMSPIQLDIPPLPESSSSPSDSNFPKFDERDLILLRKFKVLAEPCLSFLFYDHFTKFNENVHNKANNENFTDESKSGKDTTEEQENNFEPQRDTQNSNILSKGSKDSKSKYKGTLYLPFALSSAEQINSKRNNIPPFPEKLKESLKNAILFTLMKRSPSFSGNFTTKSSSTGSLLPSNAFILSKKRALDDTDDTPLSSPTKALKTNRNSVEGEPIKYTKMDDSAIDDYDKQLIQFSSKFNEFIKCLEKKFLEKLDPELKFYLEELDSILLAMKKSRNISMSRIYQST